MRAVQPIARCLWSSGSRTDVGLVESEGERSHVGPMRAQSQASLDCHGESIQDTERSLDARLISAARQVTDDASDDEQRDPGKNQ